MLLVNLVASCVVNVPAGADPILDFYCQSARAECAGRNPLEHGAVFSFRASSRYSTIGDEGRTVVKDSLVVDYFYSFGQLDSIHTVVASKADIPQFNLNPPNVFESTFVHSFFPNDTGGPELPIGFDSPDPDSESPSGIAIIDRDNYRLVRLYLFYPNKLGFKRLSRIYDFGQYDEFLVPELIIEQGAVSGIFTTTYYRLETTISDVRIRR
jgi:hypothetical protein